MTSKKEYSYKLNVFVLVDILYIIGTGIITRPNLTLTKKYLLYYNELMCLVVTLKLRIKIWDNYIYIWSLLSKMFLSGDESS